MAVALTLSELWLYPIKSFPGLSVDRLRFDNAGPVDDRRWMLVDPQGRFISQRGVAALARFAMASSDAGYRITAPDGDAVLLPDPSAGGAVREVSVWRDRLPGYEVSPELSDWFSAKLDRPVHLVHTGAVSKRRIPDPAAADAERVGFADGYPLLVCSEASLARLNRAAGLSLDMRRFRPNIVVRGLDALAELSLGRLTLEEGRIDLLKPCVRCNVPSIDPDTAEFQKTVARRIKAECDWAGQTVFGANGIARGVTALARGDRAHWSAAV